MTFIEQRVSEKEVVGKFLTKLQVAVRYPVECSNDAVGTHSIHEYRFISYALGLVSTGYRSLIDFACE
jgi:hypothetical protein